MEQKSMTALISAFSRAYHATYQGTKIFDDNVAKALFTQEEYRQIAQSMTQGIGFFDPAFQGSAEESLRRIVDRHLAPSPLGRAAFAEQALETAVRIGTRQYLIFAAGYDTFAYRQPDWAQNLTIFEIDHPATAADKKARLARASIASPPNVRYIPADFTIDAWWAALTSEKAFSAEQISFCSLLGLPYYLSKGDFRKMLLAIGKLIPDGSSLVFDYPDQDTGTDQAGERAKKQVLLASGAKEAMLAGYTYSEMEQLLCECGFLIYEHLEPDEITRQYFAQYNQENPTQPMTAFDNVNYCLAVKKS